MLEVIRLWAKILATFWIIFPYIPSDKFHYVILIQSTPLFLYFVFLFFLLVITTNFSKPKSLNFLFFATVCSIPLVSNTLFSGYGKADKQTQAFDIATWNTEYWDQKEGDQEFSNAVASFESDFILLQEHIYWDYENSTLAEIFGTNFLSTCCDFREIWQHGELVIASKSEGGSLVFQSASLLAVRYDETLIINVHVPVHITLLSNIFDEDFWQYFHQALIEREILFQNLNKLLSSNEAVILGGGFQFDSFDARDA